LQLKHPVLTLKDLVLRVNQSTMAHQDIVFQTTHIQW